MEELKDFQKIKDKIAAIIPIYADDGGNATLMVAKNGCEYYDKRSITWVFHRLSNLYFFNTPAARAHYGSLLGRSKNIPLPFSAGVTLIPFPLRKARVAGDKTTGFLVLEEINTLQAKEKEAVIILNNDKKIPVFLSSRNVEQRINEGKLVRQINKQQFLTDAFSEQSIPGSPDNNAMAAERPFEEMEYLARALVHVLWYKVAHYK